MARTTRATAMSNARKASATPMAKKTAITPIPKLPTSMLKPKKKI